jgi:hypothetical protein
VTPGYISSTPRVVREADALSAAGFDVRVVFTQGPLDAVRSFDDTLLGSRPWRWSALGWSNSRPRERWDYYRSGVRHRLADLMTRSGVAVPAVVDRAEGRVYPELATLAAAEPADLFIGHYPTGLAAAAVAAGRHRAMLGYDVEDLYADTFAPSGGWRHQRDRILDIERRYVPQCTYISAVSEPVALAFVKRFRTAPPLVVHNCHPWAARARLDGQTIERRGPELSLFWFSQTVGLDRGLQDAIRAMRLSNTPIQLHIRGWVSNAVRAELTSLAVALGVGAALHFHLACAPDELLSRAAEHDVGLALEPDDSLNKTLTVSNKLFLYLTAGLAVAATDLPGQRGILASCPGAGAFFRCGDSRALADLLIAWARQPEALAAAKTAALEAARTRWNAEAEGRTIAAAVAALLRDRSPHVRASGE